MAYFVAMVLLALLAGGFSTFATAQEHVAVGMASGVNQVPSLVAAEKGFFKDEGLTVDLKPVARGNLAVEAVAAGTLQFAEVSDVVLFSAAARGVPLVAIGVGSRGFTGKMVAAPKYANLKSLTDFKGKRIGIQVGTGVHGVFLKLLQDRGLNPSDFNVVNVRVVDMPVAMASKGTFDAVIGWDPMMQRIVKTGNGVEVISAKQFQDMAEITYPLILVAKADFVSSKRDVVQHFLNAYARAHKYIRENKDDALRIYANAIHQAGTTLDDDIIRAMMFEVDKFMGVRFIDSDWKELPRTRQFLLKTGQIKSAPELKDIVDVKLGQEADAQAK